MKTLFKILVTLFFFGLIVWQLGDLNKVLEIIKRLDFRYVLFALIVSTVDRLLMTFKWSWLLRIKGIYLPLFQGMKIYCASMIWGIFMPSTVGADAIRLFSTSRTGHDAKEILVSIVIERLIGFISALLLGMIGLIVISRQADIGQSFAPIFWLTGFVIALGTIGFSFSLSQLSFNIIHNRLLFKFRNTRIVRRIREFHASYQNYEGHKSKLLGFFGMTFGEQLMPIFFNWLLAVGFGVEVGLLFMAGALPLSILIARLPISIDGLGVFEGAFIFFLSLAGCSVAQAVSIAFAGRIVQTLSWLPWWIAHVIGSKSILPPRTDNCCVAKEV